jgi:hypothetical protein
MLGWDIYRVTQINGYLRGGESGHLARLGFFGDAGETPALPFVRRAEA